MKTPAQTPKPNCGPPDCRNIPSQGGNPIHARLAHAPFRVWAALAMLLLAIGFPSSALGQQSPPGCTGSALGINLFTSAADVHIGDTIQYSVTVFNGLAGNPQIACDAVNIEAFVVTPDGVSHVVTLRRTTLLNGQFDNYPNVASYTVRAGDILPDGTVQATATDVGDILQGDTPSRGGGFQGVNTQVSEPCIKLSAICLPGVGENGAIQFSGSVTNCGNNTLVGVTVTNMVNNGSFALLFPTNLTVGQVAHFTGSWIPADPCNPGPAILVASGTDQFTAAPRTVTSSVTVLCANVLTPGIEVTKVCPPTPSSPGAPLTYTGKVRNTGNVTLKNIVVVNSLPVANTVLLSLATLAPGAEASFTGGYPTPEACSVTDTVSVTSTTVCDVPVAASATTTCQILTTPGISVTTVCPPTPALPGQAVSYTGTVRNTGDVTLTNVVVVSDLPAPNTTVFTAATLAPGASLNFTGSHILPAGNCAVNALIEASGVDICASRTARATFLSTCAATTAPAIAITLDCPAIPAVAGGPIILAGSVRNTGNVTLTNVVVAHIQGLPSSAIFRVATLAPGASENFTATLTSPADACVFEIGMNARANDACSGLLISKSATVVCALASTPAITITQVCPPTAPAPGFMLSFTGTVLNSGNVTLTNVVVRNIQAGSAPLLTVATLAPGANATFTGGYLAPSDCSSASTSTVTATSQCGDAVAASASAVCPVLTTPGIDVSTVCPSTPVVPGTLVAYTGTVRNTGDIALTNIVVVSDQPVANTPVFTIASLAPGASATFSGSHMAPMDVCQIPATIRASGVDVCKGLTTSRTFLAVCDVATAPAILVTLICPPTLAAPGAPVAFTGTVRNTGNVTLTNVVVLRGQGPAGVSVFTAATLAPGASADFTSGFNSPVDACLVESTVSATGNDKCSGLAVNSSASASCDLATSPAVTITQACPATPAVPGAPILLSGMVRNTGNITLTNVVVMNTMAGSAPVLSVAMLAPGASAPFTASYPAPANCVSESLSTVTARSVCGGNVSDSAQSICPVLTSPSIEVTQACPTTLVVPGELLTYTGSVRNTGNIALTNVWVFNDRSGASPIFTVQSLAPGESKSFTGSYLTHLDCCVDTSTVSARGESCLGLVVKNTSTKTCVMATAPALTITKVCGPGPLRPGDTMAYSGVVSNSGNIMLLNVTVVNSQPGGPRVVLGPLILAAGESKSYSVSYVVPEDFCGDDAVTATGYDLCTMMPVVNRAATVCPVITSEPSITVTKNCPATPTMHGQPYTYTGVVKNTGKVTLVNVTLVNDNPAPGSLVFGPITLAPGQSTNYTGSYILLEECCTIVDTVTARGEDRCTGQVVSATASQACPVMTMPRILVTQACSSSSVPVGGLLSYTGAVSNTGDVVLTNVMVFSSLPAPNTIILGPIELAPGEVKKFSGSHTVTAAASQLTARGVGLCDARVVSAHANCNGPILPAAPVLSVASNAAGFVTVTWTSTPGVEYWLESSPAIHGQAWTMVAGKVTASGATASKTVPTAPAGQLFFRVATE